MALLLWSGCEDPNAEPAPGASARQTQLDGMDGDTHDDTDDSDCDDDYDDPCWNEFETCLDDGGTEEDCFDGLVECDTEAGMPWSEEDIEAWFDEDWDDEDWDDEDWDDEDWDEEDEICFDEYLDCCDAGTDEETCFEALLDCEDAA